MSKKFTPGPWHDNKFGDGFAVFAGGTSRIAYCYAVFENRTVEEAEANARLISAAPELLNALGRALFHATLRGWATTEGHELAEVHAEMKAAIAKAEASHE